MSLQDFIWPSAKDIQDAVTNKAAPAKQPLPQQTIVEKEEEEIQEAVPSLIRKKSRIGDLAEVEQEVAGKRQKKERVRKAEHEQRKPPVEEAGESEENRAVVETELPVTPVMKIPEATTSVPIDVEEMGEPSGRREEGTEQRPYSPDWMIYPGTQLTRPLV